MPNMFLEQSNNQEERNGKRDKIRLIKFVS